MMSFMKKMEKNIYSESGRSMVEMLGVLAIIGVLSIATMMAFHLLLSRFKATEIIENTNPIRQTIFNSIATGRESFSLENPYASGYLIGSKYPFTAACGYNDQKEASCTSGSSYYLIISDVEKDVCSQAVSLFQMMSDLSFYKVNNITSGSCESDTNTISVFFSDGSTHQCIDSQWNSELKACLKDDGDKFCTSKEETAVRMRLSDDFTISDDGMSISISCGFYYEMGGQAHSSFVTDPIVISGWDTPMTDPAQFGQLGGWAFVKETCYEGLKDNGILQGLYQDGWHASGVDQDSIDFSNTYTTDSFANFILCKDKTEFE